MRRRAVPAPRLLSSEELEYSTLPKALDKLEDRMEKIE